MRKMPPNGSLELRDSHYINYRDILNQCRNSASSRRTKHLFWHKCPHQSIETWTESRVKWSFKLITVPTAYLHGASLLSLFLNKRPLLSLSTLSLLSLFLSLGAPGAWFANSSKPGPDIEEVLSNLDLSFYSPFSFIFSHFPALLLFTRGSCDHEWPSFGKFSFSEFLKPSVWVCRYLISIFDFEIDLMLMRSCAHWIK